MAWNHLGNYCIFLFYNNMEINTHGMVQGRVADVDDQLRDEFPGRFRHLLRPGLHVAAVG